MIPLCLPLKTWQHLILISVRRNPAANPDLILTDASSLLSVHLGHCSWREDAVHNVHAYPRLLVHLAVLHVVHET